MKLKQSVLAWQSVADMVGANAGKELTQKLIPEGSEVRVLLAHQPMKAREISYLIRYPKEVQTPDEIALFCWVEDELLETSKV